jgi:putative transposase
MRQQYPSDLTDEQYALIQSHIPDAKHGGRPRTVDMREIINAIFYVNRTGCQWRFLPHDLPRKSTVYYYFSKWRDDGTWTMFLRVLREAVRDEVDKEPTPSMTIIDSQSVKTVGQAGEHGYDGNKKINGRKRHILVDTLGLIVAVVVTSAAVLDGEGAKATMAQINQDEFPRLEKLLGDNAYGKCGFPAWVEKNGFYELEIKDKDPNASGFKVIEWRWIVERTFAWLSRYRRNSKDYEVFTESSQAMICVSCIHGMLNKLKRKNCDRKFTYPRKT